MRPMCFLCPNCPMCPPDCPMCPPDYRPVSELAVLLRLQQLQQPVGALGRSPQGILPQTWRCR